tara:strand:- start:2639 stop:2833 length:195 start_codon:yes stop_codon:yes gene_type:complete
MYKLIEFIPISNTAIFVNTGFLTTISQKIIKRILIIINTGNKRPKKEIGQNTFGLINGAKYDNN